MFKLSRYIVSVDFYDQSSQSNKTIIYSTRSSRRIIVDMPISKALEKSGFNTIPTDLMNKLLDFKIVVETDENELDTILQENKTSLKDTSTLFFSIQPSANCSLGCDYCGQHHENTLLAEEYQEKLLEHILGKIHSKHKTLMICWFGAEPLNGIKVIRALSPKLQVLAEDKGLEYRATIVTNGLSLTPTISHELVNLFGVRKIEITIDGTKEYHDQRRHTKQGKSTFDSIYNNFLFLMDHYADQIELSLRCNVDDRNKKNMPDFIDMICADGILDHCNFYFAPIHSWGNEAHKLIEDKEAWAKEQLNWFIRIKENGKIVNLIPERVKNLCMAVSRDAELIDPYGELFKCTEVSLTPYYLNNGKNVHTMGHLTDDDSQLNARENQFGSFYDNKVIEKFPCSNCPLLPVCGGMCPKEWMEGRNACPPIKFNMKERLLLSYLWSKKAPISLTGEKTYHV